jgi:putative Mg2+ transporter-C (MgtC) family protein
VMDRIQLVMAGRILLAAVLGWVIGLERDFRGKHAGERTFALVALGAAAFTAIGVERFPVSAEKVIAGVVTGVGFLGAGLILRGEGRMVVGLTTAASAWAAAAVGVLCGAGEYWLAIFSAVLIVLLLESNSLPIMKRIDSTRQKQNGDGPEDSDDT